jgi:hypothetical protein
VGESPEAPVFATRWDLLLAWVLIGVDRASGVFSGSEPEPGRQAVCVWTSEAAITEALHVESWDVRQIKVRDLVAMLPPGIGLQVDPGSPSGLTLGAADVAALQELVPPFPPGASALHAWSGPSDDVRDALVAATQGRVRRLVAFGYTVGDSPVLGCLAHDASGPDADSVGAALEDALTATTTPAALGVPTVNIVRLDDVPPALRDRLGDEHALVRERRRRRWWR